MIIDKMQPVTVKWEVEIMTNNPWLAVNKALEMMRHPNTVATIFTVQIVTPAGVPEQWTIDADQHKLITRVVVQ